MGAKIGRALFAAIGMAVAACKVWPDTRQNPTFMYQAYFPGLGGGLRGLKQALDRLRTVARISSVIQAPTKGFSRR